MKPEYIGVGNFDYDHYVYAVCKCPVTEGWAIKFNKILDGKPHKYSCVCEDCGTEVGVYAKSYGPEYYKTESEKIDEWKIQGKNAELWVVKSNLQVRYLGTIHNIPLPLVKRQETITEFADRCRECGAKYGKMFDQETGHWNIPFLMHKELEIPISECQKAYDVAIDYLRSQADVRAGK